MQSENEGTWEPPPPPEKIEVEQHEMTEVETLGNIFFEPGRTFEDLKKKPRFIMATIIIALLITVFSFGLYYKVGDEGMRRSAAEQIEKSSQAAAMSTEQKQANIDLQITIGTVLRYTLPIFIFVAMLIGGLLYWLGGKAFGGTSTYLQSLSIWVYASLPPAVLGILCNFIVLAFKSADEIDVATASQRGVIQANPGFLFDSKTNPVLVTLVSTLDVFFIWFWILAAIGLRVMNKISAGSAWAIVIIFALIGITFRVIGAFFSGNAA